MAIELAEAAGLGLRGDRRCDALRRRSQRWQARRALAADRGPHHRPDRPPPRPLVRTGHWSHRLDVDALAELFVLDITDGIDDLDYSGPVVRRTPHRAGVLKVAGSPDGPSERDRKIFEAAAATHLRTGAPILTHCERGTGALEQVRLLTDLGVDLAHVALSHVDKVVDRGYHRRSRAGATVEYDGSFRWATPRTGRCSSSSGMIEDGFADRIVLGMDAARRGYCRVHGGSPGLAWLLDGFTGGARGEPASTPLLGAAWFVDNPSCIRLIAEVDTIVANRRT